MNGARIEPMVLPERPPSPAAEFIERLRAQIFWSERGMAPDRQLEVYCGTVFGRGLLIRAGVFSAHVVRLEVDRGGGASAVILVHPDQCALMFELVPLEPGAEPRRIVTGFNPEAADGV